MSVSRYCVFSTFICICFFVSSVAATDCVSVAVAAVFVQLLLLLLLLKL